MTGFHSDDKGAGHLGEAICEMGRMFVLPGITAGAWAPG